MNNNDALKSFAQRAKRRLAGKEVKSQAKIKVIETEDVEFKSKVDFLLSQEGVVTNPVHYLMDDKILKNMDEASRERYLLSTLDKYSSLRHEMDKASGDSRFCM